MLHCYLNPSYKINLIHSGYWELGSKQIKKTGFPIREWVSHEVGIAYTNELVNMSVCLG